MRKAGMAVTLAAFAVIVAGGRTSAQDLAQLPAEPTYPVPAICLPPLVWNGNALDQKILDAQAEMVPLRDPIRRFYHHRHR